MKKNRVIGIIGVGATNANWNADFTKFPKKVNGVYVASPFSLKYCYRNYWNLKGEKVVGVKTYEIDKKSKAQKLRNLEERLVSLGIKVKSETADIIQDKLFECIDVACFGATIAIKGFKNDYTGSIQFSEGVNKFEEAETFIETMLSPYQNSNKGESSQATYGNRTLLTEGHYFYDFIVDPQNYIKLTESNPSFKGLSDEDYNKFKEASMQCVNNYNSVAKKGCYNEFSMFVELKEGSLRLVNNLVDFVKYEKDEGTGKGIIDLRNVCKQLEVLIDDIESIEIYHNPLNTDILIGNLDKLEIKNINAKMDFRGL